MIKRFINHLRSLLEYPHFPRVYWKSLDILTNVETMYIPEDGKSIFCYLKKYKYIGTESEFSKAEYKPYIMMDTFLDPSIFSYVSDASKFISLKSKYAATVIDASNYLPFCLNI